MHATNRHSDLNGQVQKKHYKSCSTHNNMRTFHAIPNGVHNGEALVYYYYILVTTQARVPRTHSKYWHSNNIKPEGHSYPKSLSRGQFTQPHSKKNKLLNFRGYTYPNPNPNPRLSHRRSTNRQLVRHSYIG